MTDSSDDIIILSDEDDIRDEPVSLPTRAKPITRPRPIAAKSNSVSKLPSKQRTPVLILTEPKSISYGIERGYKLKCIHGVQRFSTENEIMYLVEYDKCDDYEFVPSNVLRRYCDENMLIKYLEQFIRFKN